MKKNLFYIFLPIILSTFISIIISNNINYTNFIKPPFSPPSILFPIIWPILYLLMGISYFLIKKEKNTQLESFIYYLQLFLNLTWSIIFFNFNLKFLAILWIIVLLGMVLYMVYLFYNKNKLASLLNIPYVIWLIFATYLSIGIYILN